METHLCFVLGCFLCFVTFPTREICLVLFQTRKKSWQVACRSVSRVPHPGFVFALCCNMASSVIHLHFSGKTINCRPACSFHLICSHPFMLKSFFCLSVHVASTPAPHFLLLSSFSTLKYSKVLFHSAVPLLRIDDATLLLMEIRVRSMQRLLECSLLSFSRGPSNYSHKTRTRKGVVYFCFSSTPNSF